MGGTCGTNRRLVFSRVLTGGIVAAALLLFACRPAGGWIMDFEEEDQLDRLLWTCPVAMERTPGISGRGEFALTAHLMPDLYPGVEIFKLPGNWAGYRFFEFTVAAPRAAGEILHVRIDDKKVADDYDERYEGQVRLLGGVQKVKIPLEEIRRQPARGPLNLRKIRRIIFYLYDQKKPVDLTLDDLRLSY